RPLPGFSLGSPYESPRRSAKDGHRRYPSSIDIYQLRAIGRPLWREAVGETYRVAATDLPHHDARPAWLSRRVRQHFPVRRECGGDLEARFVGELPRGRDLELWSAAGQVATCDQTADQ